MAHTWENEKFRGKGRKTLFLFSALPPLKKNNKERRGNSCLCIGAFPHALIGACLKLLMWTSLPGPQL